MKLRLKYPVNFVVFCRRGDFHDQEQYDRLAEVCNGVLVDYAGLPAADHVLDCRLRHRGRLEAPLSLQNNM